MQPYKFLTVKDNYYRFTTTAGTQYACYFLSYNNYFADYREIADLIFAFNLEVIKSGEIIEIDPRIGKTVVEIITIFLNGLENAVVYVCDNSDNKEIFRKRKFDSWFREFDDGTIIKIDGHISFENFEIFNAILIHKNNPKKNRFIEAFNDLNDQEEK